MVPAPNTATFLTSFTFMDVPFLGEAAASAVHVHDLAGHVVGGRRGQVDARCP